MAAINAGLLSQDSKQLPEKFIEVDQSHRASLECVDPDLDIPVLDLAFLATGDESKRSAAVVAAAKACQTWGFFQIQNHGVDQSLIERCEQEAHRMFQLPLEAKQRCHRPPGASFGYGANTWINQKVMHWAESFHMQLNPTSNIREMASKLFPDGTSSHQFSEAVEEYMVAVENLASQVLEILTEGLGLEPSCFSEYLRRERMTSMRFNFYPPCPEPSLAIGLRAHTDPHLLTILHQDSIPGLQVQMGERWITVKPRPDCFVVNIGDLFQILSNTRYKSVLHRAIVNSEKQRLSLACFLNPPLNSTVVAPPELITPDCPQVYRPFTWLEYLKNAYLYHPNAGNERHERFYLKSLVDVPAVAPSSVH